VSFFVARHFRSLFLFFDDDAVVSLRSTASSSNVLSRTTPAELPASQTTPLWPDSRSRCATPIMLLITQSKDTKVPGTKVRGTV